MREDKKSSKKILEREDIDIAYKWDIEKIYKDDEEWEQDFKKAKELTNDFVQYQGKLNDSKKLLQALQLYEGLLQKVYKLYTYGKMRRDENNQNPKYQALTDRAQSLHIEVESAISFFTPELLQINEEEIEKFLNEEEGLKKYHQFLMETLRNKPHVLSVQEEKIIAQAGDLAQASENIYDMLNDADMRFPEIADEKGEIVELTAGNFTHLMESKNREVRKTAFYQFYGTYSKYKNTLAATFNANLKKDGFYAKVRKHNSSLEASLFESNIPVEVYDKLIEAVNENLHLMHRYMAIREKMLKIDDLHMYDIYTPIVEGVDIKITYQEAKDMVMEGLAALGEEYCNTIKFAFDNRWVDVYENKGKSSGAYSWGTYDSYPFILMNYKDNVDNLFTLAHEMGHSIHSYYTVLNQPFIYSNYKIFVAEVASTVNEALLMDYMISKNEDKKVKMYYINHFLEQFRTTMFRQTMFAEFEKITHEMVAKGDALTAEKLCEIYYELNRKYYGSDMTINKEIEIEWARIPHFYRSFYVYQYATGFSAAIALSKQIKQDGEKAVDSYLKFLKSGSIDYPINLLKNAGVDMTSKKPVEMALKVFADLLDEMEKLVEEN
ncbi:oligoendopeptidase F [Alkaliphilus peptidifermentans]|uniref:Oligopeptidase F n=1 Tax=Alkaliphilus peptidifermentans DSM 18978 TaxID=1120976 RepID=A0A1G5CL88_9FIRM|nr:oligoendopeptidase F [Alkaliphilus peptidifermentans]SCY03255.1 oligopeptidase F. Metallo peptidase. MEROPS family M03B [Alkaliphilus peptidifermentans DSM 18978]